MPIQQHAPKRIGFPPVLIRQINSQKFVIFDAIPQKFAKNDAIYRIKGKKFVKNDAITDKIDD